MSELKCCPFCGGEAVLDREDIFCDNCYLSMRIDSRLSNGEAETYEEARQQAIETWNNRTTMANIVDKLKELPYGRSYHEYAEKGIVHKYLERNDVLDIVKQEINNGLE